MLNPNPDKMKGKPEPVDVHVGRRIRMRRIWMQVTLTALADAIGVTFQQVQKYEKGTNRVGASRLQQIADALVAPVSYFFEDMPGAAPVGGDNRSGQKKLQPEIIEFASSDVGLALIRAFSQIRDCQEFCAVGHDDEKERIITWLSRKNFWTSSWLDVIHPRFSARTVCWTI